MRVSLLIIHLLNKRLKIRISSRKCKKVKMRKARAKTPLVKNIFQDWIQSRATPTVILLVIVVK